MNKRKVILIGVLILILLIIVSLLLFLFNPSLSLSLMGNDILFTDRYETEYGNYTVYVTEKDGTLGIKIYLDDGFFGSLREAGIGSGDNNTAHGVIVLTGVRNGKPFTENIDVYATEADTNIIDDKIICSEEFKFKDKNYKLVYSH
ncbi:MAG: hypothetical protein E7564_01525 [Ruminococcaceae bacterium]|nr:hypothetical protein [Oscillospiraceae bacterium]